MKKLTKDLNRIAKTQELAFFDKCQVLTFVGNQDSYGDNVKTYTSGSVINCSVDVTGGTKTYKDNTIQSTNETVIHLPLATSITNQDKIKVTTILDTTVNTEYQVLEVETGVGVLVVKAKRIQV